MIVKPIQKCTSLVATDGPKRRHSGSIEIGKWGMLGLLSVFLFAAGGTKSEESTRVYWVFFQDKGNAGTSQVHLKARKQALAQRFHELSPRTIARRQRIMGTAEVVDASDLAVSSHYVSQIQKTGVHVRAYSRWLNAVSVVATPSQLAKIRQQSAVSKVEQIIAKKRRKKIIDSDTTSIPSFPDRLGAGNIDYGMAKAQLEQIGVPAAHECGLRGKGVVIGVLDSGFDTKHASLKNVEVLGARDFVHDDDNVANESNDPAGQHNHGTSVLSLIAGWDPGSFVGVAPEVSVLLAKTEDLSQEDVIEEDWYVEGLEWAESKGADIATSSLGYLDWIEAEDLDGKTAITSKAVAAAVKRGLICLTASGNSGPGAKTLGVPADADGVITIGSVDLQGKISSFSSRGPTADGRIKPDLVAPGSNVWLAKAGGSYERSSGTSFATPLTAGIVALLFELNPSLTPESMIKLLRDTAKANSSSPDSTYGWGLVDAMKASQELCDCQDADGDGHRDAECGGDDCDDSNKAIHPDAIEDCDDGIDNNCNDKTDQEDEECEDSEETGSEEDTSESEEDSGEEVGDTTGESTDSTAESESDSSDEESTTTNSDSSEDNGESEDIGVSESDSDDDDSDDDDDDDEDSDDDSLNDSSGIDDDEDKSENSSNTMVETTGESGGCACSMIKTKGQAKNSLLVSLMSIFVAGWGIRSRKR